jgi:hypothetical protein
VSGFLDFLQDPRFLNTAGAALEAGGNLTSAFNRFEFGAQQRQAAIFSASQLRDQGVQDQAAAQRSAWDADRTAKYVASEALAQAAASGGGASDPTVLNIISHIKAEGAYRQSLALYQGDARARLLNMQADAKEYEGALAERQSDEAGIGNLFAVGTSLLKGYARDSSMLQRFGGGGPSITRNG